MKKHTNTINQETQIEALAEKTNVTDDFKHALLITSLLANIFVLIAWVILQVTTIYDHQVATFLFYR